MAGSRQSILAITSGLPTSARNLQDEGTEASLPHLYELQGGRRSYRLQDARKTRRISQRIKFVILMDEQQPSIVLLQSILQQSPITRMAYLITSPSLIKHRLNIASRKTSVHRDRLGGHHA